MAYRTYDGAYIDYDDPSPPTVNLICHDDNLSYYPDDDGWLCPECGKEGELEDVEVERQRSGSFVALSRNWLGEYYDYHGEGPTPQEAIESLYARIKKDVEEEV